MTLDELIREATEHFAVRAQALAKVAPAEVPALLDEATRRWRRHENDWELPRVAQALLALEAPVDGARLAALLELMVDHGDTQLDGWLAALDRLAQRGEDAAPLVAQLRAAMQEEETVFHLTKEQRRRVSARLDAVAGTPALTGPRAGEAWAERALADLATAGTRAAWAALFAHTQGADAARPSARWQKRAAELVGAVGRAEFVARLAAWLPLVQKPKELKRTGWSYVAPISDDNTLALTILVWSAGAASVAEAADTLGDLATVCFTKIAGFGPVSAKVGNACVWALGAMPGVVGVTQLSRLKVRVKYNVALRLIERALGDTATRAGISVADLEELGVPRLGLDDDGAADVALGEWTAHLRLGRKAELSWSHPTKKAPRSATPPKEAKAAPEWKELKKRLADIGARLDIERARLENMWLAERELAWSDFAPRYLQQPIVAALARRLLWSVDDTTALWRDSALRDLGGAALAPAPDARVRLWHPIGQPAEQLAVWQDLLEQHGVVQPFKQAHRELYALEEEERQNVTYSNRFAGHIIRQHQFAALLKTRGWHFRLMGAFDSHNTPHLNLPRWGMQAELAVDYPSQSDEGTTASGIYTHIRTDQVRFTSGGRALPLSEVPPLVFSELMRDIDLFVSVSSIGNDPAWRDTGERGYGAYWLEYVDGPLSPAAVTRREVLRRVLARTTIAERVSADADGRHLVVRGELARYRVHYGSGLVFVVENDAHLPLPTPARDDSVVLPFEDDWLLGVILAKALALADDRRLPAELRAIASAR